MRSAGFLTLDREKIGTKLYGYVLAKRYTCSLLWVPSDAGFRAAASARSFHLDVKLPISTGADRGGLSSVCVAN